MIKKIFGFSAGTWIGALITFVSMPIATYLFNQEELGKINYYFSIINIFLSIILLGLDQAYIRYFYEYRENIQKKLFSCNLLCSTCITICTCFFFYIIQYPISSRLINSEIDSFLLLFASHVIGLLVTRYFQLLYRFQGNILWFTIISTINIILLKVVYLGEALFSRNAVNAIIFSAVTSAIVAIIVLLANMGKITLNIHLEKNILIEEFKYAIPIIPMMLVAVLNNYLPILFLKEYTNYSNVALYSIAVTIGSIVTLIHNGLNTFFEPFVFANYKHNIEKVKKLGEAICDIMAFAAISLFLIQELILKIYNKSYFEASYIIPILICSSLFYALSDFWGIGIKISKRMVYNAVIYTISTLINMLTCYFLVPYLDVIGAAISAAFSSLCLIIMKTYKANQYYKISNIKKYIPVLSLLILGCLINKLISIYILKYIILFIIWSICVWHLNIINYCKIIISKYWK